MSILTGRVRLNFPRTNYADDTYADFTDYIMVPYYVIDNIQDYLSTQPSQDSSNYIIQIGIIGQPEFIMNVTLTCLNTVERILLQNGCSGNYGLLPDPPSESEDGLGTVLDIVSSLHARLSLLEGGHCCDLAAHIPYGRVYAEDEECEFISPQYQETKFADRYGREIYDDYLDDFEEALDQASEWIKSTKKNIRNSQSDSDYFESSIIYFSLEIDDNNLKLTKVIIRPCAEGNGFYRALLWKLRNEVLIHGFDSLIVTLILSNNQRILRQMGFRLFENTDGTECDAELSKDELQQITKQRWRIPETFPSADQLNDERFVNRHIEQFSLGPGKPWYYYNSRS